MSHVSRLNYLGGEFIKTSDFNLTELPLATGSLPVSNATVTLQYSPEGLNKLVLTLTSPTSGFLQYTIYPKFLDSEVIWTFTYDHNNENTIVFSGIDHKTVYTNVQVGDFKLTGISQSR